MENNYFSTSNNGNGRFPTSRRGKKSGGSDKPKQPQRGLGVAQLEKIRLSSQQLDCAYVPAAVHHPYAHNFIQEDHMRSYSSSSSSSPSNYGFSGSYGSTMRFQDYERANIRNGNFQPNSTVERRQSGNENQHFMHPSMMNGSHFLDSSHVDQGSFDTMNKRERKNEMNFAFNMYNQNSESTNSQDIDLELRL